ncbi:MAG: response regulator transcription factor [Roseinatronobacter sp.]
MRLLIADDHKLLRDTLSSFLAQQDDIDVVTVGDTEEAQRAISSSGPFDLVLLDYGMPGMNALNGLRAILDAPDAPPVVLISGFAPHDMVERAFQMGIRGFLHKTMNATSLLNAIRFMALGERFVPVDFVTGVRAVSPEQTSAARGTIPASQAENLTAREKQVLLALCEGQTNKEIARALNLSEPTIKLHVKTLYRRLGVSNRTQAAMIAREQGLC